MRSVGLMIVAALALSLTAADATQPAAINTVCPVQPDMPIDEWAEFATYNGTTYALCCNSCKDDFEANPAHWARVVAIQMQAAAAGEPIPVIPAPAPGTASPAAPTTPAAPAAPAESADGT